MRAFTNRELLVNSAAIARDYVAFRRRPYAPREHWQAYQLRQVQRLVAFAYENVPLYRDKYRAKGLYPRDLRTLADLAHFPTVSKSEVLAAYPAGALARGLDLDRCLFSKSSGSTGHVLTVVHRADRLSIQGLAMNRLIELYQPYRPWHRLAYIYTSEYPARSLFGLYPMLFIHTLAPMDELLAQLKAIRPDFLACYPSHLRALAVALGPPGCQALKLKAISVSSELSTQRERDELARLFGCGVYDEYSTEELTHVAAQCRANTYHLFEDVAYLEVVSAENGQPLPAGEWGEVVGTYLHNYAMPFIRYQQGDSAALDEAPCRCGRTFRALKGLQGRKLDHFILPSGRVLTSGWLLDASYSFLLDVGADIAAYRLIQEAVDWVRIEIVPGRAYTAAMTEAVRARFLALVAEPITVQVEVVTEIARAGGGKHHPIVSRVAQASAA
jgi:phenylacetate-CoA ligase